MRRVNGDLVVALGFAALALAFIVEGRALPVVARGIPGPGLFPLLVAAIILLFAVVLAVRALVGRRGERAAAVQPGDADLSPTALADGTGIASHDGAGADGAAPAGSATATATATEAATPDAEEEGERSLLRPLVLWGLVLLVAVALPVLGFVPAMLLLTLVLVLLVERRHDVAALATAVAVPLAAYALFAVLLDVRLPMGPFE